MTRPAAMPQGYYNIEVMLHQVGRHGGTIGVCGSCMDARGLADVDLTEMARRRSTLEELTTWVLPPPMSTTQLAPGRTH